MPSFADPDFESFERHLICFAFVRQQTNFQSFFSTNLVAMILRAMRAPRLNQARKVSQYLVVIERCKAAGQAHPSRTLHGAVEKDPEQPDSHAHNTHQFNHQDWKKLDENPLEKYLSPEYKVDSFLDLTSEDAIPLKFCESVDKYTLFNV